MSNNTMTEPTIWLIMGAIGIFLIILEKWEEFS